MSSTSTSRSVNIINKLNESLSIYKSIIVCDTKEDVSLLINELNEYNYVCNENTKNNHTRIIVKSYPDFIQNIDIFDFTEITVIYVSNVDYIQTIYNYLTSDMSIRMVPIIVIM